MDGFFDLYVDVVCGVIKLTAFITICLALYIYTGMRVRKALKPVQYISYKKNHFHEDFEFVCEFCGSTVSSKDEKCPICAGAFGKNKEYQSKRRAVYQKYLLYLKDQEKAIQKEMNYMRKMMIARKIFKEIEPKSFYFDMGVPPIYKPAIDYEFTCEYCDNKLRGKSADEQGCNNCGASYKENLELSVREEEDRLEKRHYDQYMELKDWEWEQNVKDERKYAKRYDTYIPASVWEKRAKIAAILFLIVIFLLPAVKSFFVCKLPLGIYYRLCRQ